MSPCQIKVEVLRVPILPKGVRCSWFLNLWGERRGECGDDGVLVLARGWVGERDVSEQVQMVLTELHTRVRETIEAGVIRAALEVEPVGRRTVHRMEGTNYDGKAIWVLWTLFYCEDVDQTFLATYAAFRSEADGPLRELLRGLHCPARRPAAELLTENAVDNEAHHPDPVVDLE